MIHDITRNSVENKTTNIKKKIKNIGKINLQIKVKSLLSNV